MRKTVFKYAFMFTVLAFTGAALMHISHTVQRLEKEVAANNKIVQQEEEAIRVLKAEWAYLNTPERLEAMATKGLGMAVPETKKVITNIENMPEPEQDDRAVNISYQGQE